jgi:hypothetical protein
MKNKQRGPFDREIVKYFNLLISVCEEKLQHSSAGNANLEVFTA